LLLYGPPGTGKTTTIVNLINAYQNKLGFKNKDLIIHLNASDERGIDIIRNQISFFVNSKPLFHSGMKFVILDEVDYYFVINGDYTITFPNKSNIKLYKRENKGYDFGAYSYVIDKLKVYDYYFFMNTSVKGPYLKNNDKWYDRFLPLFNDNVHLVGTSINICTSKIYCVDSNSKVKPHVQSMFFCLDKKYFNELKDENFFNESEINNMTFTELIRNKEVGLSEIALKKGYNINCILSKYKGLDYLNVTEDINPTSIDGDSYFNGKYFGQTIDPYEVIFFKTNRDN
jgi:GTPase SAR1 family protein